MTAALIGFGSGATCAQCGGTGRAGTCGGCRGSGSLWGRLYAYDVPGNPRVGDSVRTPGGAMGTIVQMGDGGYGGRLSMAVRA